MKIVNGKIVLGVKNCSCTLNCDETKWGKETNRIACPKCKGSGKGKRGGRGGCKGCYGSGQTWTWENAKVCSRCDGRFVGSENENICDNITQEDWQSLSFVVYRHNRLWTGNEALLGFGCVYSSTDYGAAMGKTDEAIIAEVKAHTYVQASSIAKEDGTICNHIGIFVCSGGYSVRPVYQLATTLATIACERSEDDYMAKGMAIAVNGGNGTIEALYKV